MTLYANENYEVELDATNTGYWVRNRKTNVVEVESKVLPDAIFAAAQLHDAMVKQPWTWFEKQETEARPADVLM